MQELWVEKYRPKKIDEYVFRDDHQRKQVLYYPSLKISYLEFQLLPLS